MTNQDWYDIVSKDQRDPVIKRKSNYKEKKGKNMKFQNIKDIEEFQKMIESCKGDIFIKASDEEMFNLKSPLNTYIAIDKLLKSKGEDLEIFAREKEDEKKILDFITDLANNDKYKN